MRPEGWSWSLPAGELGGLIFYVLVALVVGAVGYFLYTVFSHRPTIQRNGETDQDGDALIALEGTATSWEDALQQARAALAAGDAYRAIWITHRLFLGFLSSNQRLAFERWKTNSDYLQEYQGGEDGFGLLKELTHCYDTLVYAGDPMPLAQVESLLERVAQKGGRLGAR